LPNPFRKLFRRIGEFLPAGRHDRPGDDEDEAASKGPLDRLAQGSGQLRAVVVNSIIALAVILGAATLIDEAFRDSAVIDPIQVPDELAKQGYRPEVIARRLRDEVLEIRRIAASRREGREIQPDSEQLNIELPGTGISLGSLLRIVKRFFESSETRVTGEIVSHDGEYELRLRFLGHGLHAEIPARSQAELDDLLHLGAREMMKISEPYILAAYLADVDQEEALKAIVHSLENDDEDDDHWALTLWGWLLTTQDRHQEAIAKYQAALERKDDFILAASDWGITLTRMEKHDEAIAQFERALTWDPNFHGALNNWGVALVGKGQTEAAIAKFREALEIDPKFVRAHNNLGAALAKLKRHDEAMEVYATALDIDPWNSDTLRNWGDLLLAMKEYEQAAERYQKAAKSDSTDAHVFLNWGIALSELDQGKEAIARFETSVALDPSLVRAYNSWGAVYDKQKLYDEAAAQYRKAVEQDPDYAPAHRNLGSAYFKLGRCELAIDHLQSAIKIDKATYGNLEGAVRRLEGLTKNKSENGPCK
jgi:tetratricopeptide (TPR) repeat protein